MQITLALFLTAFSLVSAVPTPDGWSKDHHDTPCEYHDVCKDHDWTACKDWKPHHRRDGWDDHSKDYCEHYDKCKDYDWHACKDKDEHKPEHKDDHWDDHKDEHWDDDKWDEHKNWSPFHFTSTLEAYAGPDQVVNNSNVPVYGLKGGYGHFKFGLNSKEDVICWNISVYIRGDYQSPAKTATHIHQGPKGRAGPPRLVFPNPQPRNGESLNDFAWRYSLGCQWGPFETGVVNNGTDSGAGFKIKQLEDAPWEFFADTHTSEFPAGAIRGQIYEA